MWYFAYGSNMDLERMEHRGVQVKKRFPGVLSGYTLVFDVPSKQGGAAANIIANNTGTVEGILYWISKNSLDTLATFEVHYRQKEVTITKFDGEAVKACVFISDQHQPDIRPTKDYLAHLLKGQAYLSHYYWSKIKHIYNNV